MENKRIILKYIDVNAYGEKMSIARAEKVTAKLEDAINKQCPEGYKYKETISFVNIGKYENIEAIVAYEQIPR